VNNLLSITKALSDSHRVRTLMALDGRELCVCQIVELLGLAPSTVSRHLSILAMAGLVESRKDGRWVHYHLPNESKCSDAVRESIVWMRRILAEDAKMAEDRIRLRDVLEINPEDLCRRQLRRVRSDSGESVGQTASKP
jgi:DNA-binding transcriptional ArsR family regulator